MNVSALQQAVALLRQGRLAEAEVRLRALHAAQPLDPTPAHYLGLLLLQAGKPHEALDVLSTPAQRGWQTAMLLATAARGAGRPEQALSAVADVLRTQPAHRPAQLLHAELLSRLGRHDDAEHAARALAVRGDADALALLGVVLLERGASADAVDAIAGALRQRPDDAGLQYNLGLALERSGSIEHAQRAFEIAAHLAPRVAAPWSRAAALSARRCDFDAEARAVTGLDAALSGAGPVDAGDLVEPLLATFLPLTPATRRTVLERQAAAATTQALRFGLPERATAASGTDRRLRVGYLSADFGAHAVGALLQPVLAAHDGTRVDARLYALRERDDAVATQYREHPGYRRLAGLSLTGAARAIAADAPDILVDLGGYTDGAQPALPAARLAPLQLAWLGYIGGMAAPFIDYQIVDAALVPAPLRDGYDEALLRLPRSLLPLAAPPDDLDASLCDRDAVRRDSGLPDGFLYACFNNAYKIDRDVVDAWAQILGRRPDAQLVLAVADEARPLLRHHWEALGGDPARLHFVERIDPAAHLRRAACCDLFLDTFRYHAGATGVSAARAGLPVLCLPGTTPAARMGASLSHTLGVDELVADSRAHYIDTAVALAAEPAHLTSLRSRILAALRGPLGDPTQFARLLERAYQTAWRRQREGLAPADLEIGS